MTPTFPQLSVWGEVVNRERDPKCKQTKSPHLRSGAPRSPRCPRRPSRPGPGCSPWDTSTYTHSRRSCQNPDILINPRSTTLTDAAERWMQKGTTPDPCQGWREQLLQGPPAPCPRLQNSSPQTSPSSVGSTAAPNNDGGEPIHPEAGNGGPRCPRNPARTQHKRRRTSMQTLSHTIGLVSNTKRRFQRKFSFELVLLKVLLAV